MKRSWRFRGWRWLVAAAGVVPLVGVARHREMPPIAAVAFAPDGRALATACYGAWGNPERWRAEVRAWDLATGRVRRGDRRMVDDLTLEVDGGGSTGGPG